ncbi:ankyrin repeat domain-containing protein, partial [bacterium]|nr:ankyrin repeat domain-containing protein [bacterium]
GELRANIEGSEWTRQHQDDAQVRTMLQPVIIGRLQEMLGHIGIPVNYRTDVHHINLVMRLMYGGENRPIPEPLKDPFVPAYRATIESNARTIQRGFADPIWVLSAYGDNCIASNTPIPTWGDLPAKVPGMGIGPSLTINSEEKTKLLEAVFKQLPFEDLRDFLQGTDITALHLELGGHGLLGIAARVGQKKDVVDWLQSSLVERSSDAVMPSLDRDGMGYTLMDYAVLGGNTELATDVWNASDATQREAYLTASASSTTVPSLMGLAGESGRAAMVYCVAAIAGGHTAPMITARDSEGNTALMRAAMSGNPEAVQAMIDQCVANQVGVSSILNHVNSAGQTALILAIAHGKSADCVRLILTNGADPNTRVMSSWLSALEMVMMDGHLDILQALLEHPDINISDRALTTVVDRDCTVALYNKALERKPELLSRRLPSGTSIASWLAVKNGAALRELLADKDPRFVQGILSIRDLYGDSVAHQLAAHNFTALRDMLAGKDDEFVHEILSIPGEYECSVAHWLAEHNGAALREILAEKSDEFVRAVLLITYQDGSSVSRWLAEHNQEALRDILVGKDQWFVQGILSIQDANHSTVSEILFYRSPNILRAISPNVFARYPAPPRGGCCVIS